MEFPLNTGDSLFQKKKIMKFGWWWSISAIPMCLAVSVPLDSSNCTDSYPSACANGGQGIGKFGYACPHMMMLSDEMIAAAAGDGLEDMVYAVAGGSRDDECGKCYQVQLLDAEREWRDDFPLLVVQIVNSGFDVLHGQLDIFMGGGGFGYFTACNADCGLAYCQGGPCRESMYDGSFRQWVNAEYDDPNLCYSGGIKWLDQKNKTALERLCRGLSNFGNDAKANATTSSCLRSNLGLFHQNFVAIRYREVECPLGLYQTTGLHRYAPNVLPVASKDLELTEICQGDRAQGRFCITTMQDCCKMSCAWSGKIPSDAYDLLYPCVATCDRDGQILTN